MQLATPAPLIGGSCQLGKHAVNWMQGRYPVVVGNTFHVDMVNILTIEVMIFQSVDLTDASPNVI